MLDRWHGWTAPAVAFYIGVSNCSRELDAGVCLHGWRMMFFSPLLLYRRIAMRDNGWLDPGTCARSDERENPQRRGKY
jgi:hypothetical protein